MSLRRLLTTLLVVACAGLHLGAAGELESKDPVDPQADAMLRRMSADLVALRTFRVKIDHTTEVVREDGLRLHLASTHLVSVQRPSDLRSDELGALGETTIFFDGRALTVLDRQAGFYATAPAPPTIDEAVDFARDGLGIDAPAADLLRHDVYEVLRRDVEAGFYVGPEVVNGVVCSHLAFRGRSADWQIWISESHPALPCKFLIASKEVAGEPEFMAELREWDFEPSLPPGTFTFHPPPGMVRIDFWSASGRRSGP